MDRLVTPAARALAQVVRDMPRAPLDWTHELLSDEQYRRLMDEVAYTLESTDAAMLAADVERITAAGAATTRTKGE